MSAVSAIIFDFDGVIANSEALANTVLAEHVSRLGRPTTLDESLVRYSGRRWADAMALIEQDLGAALPDGFSDTLAAATLERFERELREVEGASAFIRRLGDMPHCIASSSSPERLALCLRVLGLEQQFEGRVFSAEGVRRGKPAPDIFLHAADRLGVAPQDCIVVEDSATGVQAAVAADMTCIGLSAASHVREGHEARLRAAGAVHLAASWAEVADIVIAAGLPL